MYKSPAIAYKLNIRGSGCLELSHQLTKTMRDKLTQKQENFCLNLFKGMSQREAYITAGYSSNNSVAVQDVAACILAKDEKVLIRLDELRNEAKSPLIADYRERQEILTEILRGRVTDYTTCGPDRDLIDVGLESPNTAALQEVTSRTEFDKDGAGVAVVTKVKLHNPMQAAEILNKMDKVYDDRVQTGATVVNSFTFILPNGNRVTPKELKDVIDV